jgi:hypothetical protein
VELLDHVLILCFTFRGTGRLFSKLTGSIYFPTSIVGDFPFSPPFVIVSLFDYIHTGGCEAVSHCDTEFHFPNEWFCWASFLGLLEITYLHLEKYSDHFSIFMFLLLNLF